MKLDEEFKNIKGSDYSIRKRDGRVKNKGGQMLKFNCSVNGIKSIQLKDWTGKFKELNIQSLVRSVYNDDTLIIDKLNPYLIDESVSKNSIRDLKLKLWEPEIISELLEWGKDNNMVIESDSISVLIADDEFITYYSRISKVMQCYYKGHGMVTIERPLDKFNDLKSLIYWIKDNKKCKFQRPLT